MIKELENRITAEQLDAIVGVIRERYALYKELEHDPRFVELFNGEYQTNKKKQGLTLAIHNGFPSNNGFGSLLVDHMDYDSERGQPRFINDHIVMLILFDSSSYHAKYLESLYAYNRDNFQGAMLFAYLKVSFKNNQLTITLSLPDANQKTYAKEVLYSEKDVA